MDSTEWVALSRSEKDLTVQTNSQVWLWRLDIICIYVPFFEQRMLKASLSFLFLFLIFNYYLFFFWTFVVRSNYWVERGKRGGGRKKGCELWHAEWSVESTYSELTDLWYVRNKRNGRNRRLFSRLFTRSLIRKCPQCLLVKTDKDLVKRNISGRKGDNWVGHLTAQYDRCSNTRPP